MKGARVTEWGSAPQYMDVPDLPAPSPSQLQLKMLAIGVHRLVQARAAGKHSSSKGAALPFDPSVDGVGVDEATGDMYYISIGPRGAASLFNERANVEKTQLVKLDPRADPVAVAALVNPVSSSWMALQCRTTENSCKGRTVLILGATGTSGRTSVAVAKSLGAARIVGMGRSEVSLAQVEGLDERVVIQDPVTLPPDLGPIDIVLDYVSGRVAVGVIETAAVRPGDNLQYIHIGDLSGEGDLVVPSRLLNMKPIRITGSGMGSWTPQEIRRETPALVAAAAEMERSSDIFTVPLSDVQSCWEAEIATKQRLVLVL